MTFAGERWPSGGVETKIFFQRVEIRRWTRTEKWTDRMVRRRLPKKKSEEKKKRGAENDDHRRFNVNSHFPTSRVKRKDRFLFVLADDENSADHKRINKDLIEHRRGRKEICTVKKRDVCALNMKNKSTRWNELLPHKNRSPVLSGRLPHRSEKFVHNCVIER